MTTKKYPLLFDYNEVLSGFGKAIAIHLKGRALVSEEGDGWWISGVNPGGVAGGGLSFSSAFSDFRRRIKALCIDFLSESQDFDSFKRELELFFNEEDTVSPSEWEDAREAVRSGGARISGIAEEKCPPQPSAAIRIAQGPSDNVLEPQPQIAA